jgi:hypothetical protein
MSGCWVVVFSVNGAMHVGHIGTSTVPAETDAAKEAWKLVESVPAPRGFNPLRALQANLPQVSGDGPPDVFGLVTANPIEFYAVWTFKGNGTDRPVKVRRIAGIKKVASGDASAPTIFP